MQQEDYLKRQIDQLGQVLGKMLAGLLGLKTMGEIGGGFDAIDQVLKSESDLKFTDLIHLPTEKLIELLHAEKKWNSDNIEMIADVLFLYAEELGQREPGNGLVKKILQKCLVLYEHLDMACSTYSYDRHEKIRNIKRMF
jgi:hypothetical protein